MREVDITCWSDSVKRVFFLPELECSHDNVETIFSGDLVEKVCKDCHAILRREVA